MRIQPSISLNVSPAKDTPVNKEDAELKKVCSEFESILVLQMLKQMRASVMKADLFGSSQKEEMFQDMMDEEIAKDFSKTGSIGLGEMMYRQLIAQKNAKVSAESVDKKFGENRASGEIEGKPSEPACF